MTNINDYKDTVVIKHYNDGKEKSQSYECYLDVSICDNCENIHIHGYGENEEEAYHDIMKEFLCCIKDIQNVFHIVESATSVNDLKNKADVAYIAVDCIGELINE